MNTFILNGGYEHMHGRQLFCDFASFGFGGPLFRWGARQKQASIDNLPDEVRWADSIFLSGGETLALIWGLKQSDWIPNLQGKTIVAVSAGVSALAVQSFNVDHQRIITGLGLIPFKTIVHYRPDMRYMADALEKTEPEFPVLMVSDDSLVILRR